MTYGGGFGPRFFCPAFCDASYVFVRARLCVRACARPRAATI